MIYVIQYILSQANKCLVFVFVSFFFGRGRGGGGLQYPIFYLKSTHFFNNFEDFDFN